jgi:ketosteroid isomerase-like protein
VSGLVLRTGTKMAKAPMQFAACLLIAATALPAAARALSDGWKQSTLAAAAQYIDRANNDWSRAIVTGDADVLSAPYDKDGVFIRPDGSAVRGKAAVRDMYKKRPSSLKVFKASIRSDGRIAHDPNDVYEWGTASMTIRRGHAIQQTSGRYLTVWHRDSNIWVITRNIAF